MINSKISIIVPVYNVEKYLKKCLDSLVNQTYKNIEIICVNDGSTDNSLDILNEYANKDERVIVVNKKNGGISDARNVGISNASGEYMMFVDSDDWVDLETCKYAINKIKLHNADIIMWSYIREYKNKSIKKIIFKEESIFEGYDLKKLHKSFIGYVEDGFFRPDNMDSLSTVWGKLYKKRIINGIKFYNIKEIGSYEDGLFNLSVFKRVQKVIYVNEFFYHYRKNNPNSLTSCYNPDLELQRKKLYSLIKEHIEENNYDSTYNKSLQNRIVYEILYLGLNDLERKDSFFNHINKIKKIINTPEYRKACRNFNYKEFRFHWRVFYKAAVFGNVFLLFFLLKTIQIIRKKVS